MSWYVLYTKPKAEKKVAERLESLEIRVFCPVVVEVRKWSDRTKKVISPLFKSYVFVKPEEKQRNKVFEVPGVIRYMYWLGKPAIVREREIEVIKDWLDNDKVDQVEVDHLSPGDKVTISEGAFKNQEAIIREVGQKRMRLVLPNLGCTVVVKTKDVL